MAPTRIFRTPQVRQTGRQRAPRRTRGPTMTDVALEAGVSQTTVSLVLNEVAEARLAKETRQRVVAAAARLGYKLAHGASRPVAPVEATTIGFVVDEISTDPWMALALDGARERAWASGLTVSVAVTRGDAGMEDAIMQKIVAQPLLGLIYGKIHTLRIDPHPFLFARPTVLLNCYLANRTLPSVVPAEVAGGRTATARLIRAGHQRIAFINGEPWMDASRDRLKGYRQSLAAADLAFDPALVRDGNWEPSSGYQLTRELMTLPKPPTAIFCANDLMAIGCYDALRELKLKIPRDIAVIGYDDRETARYMHPPLTTVVLPHFEMGATAVETLLDTATHRTSRAPQIKEEGPLIERQSV